MAAADQERTRRAPEAPEHGEAEVELDHELAEGDEDAEALGRDGGGDRGEHRDRRERIT